MNRVIRKFILFGAVLTLLMIGASEASSAAVLADSKEPKKTPPSITEEFKVNEFLKVDDKKVDGKDVAGSGQRSFVPSSGEADKADKGIIGFLVVAINLLVKIIGSLALIVFIIGAILTISSEGKEDRLEKGKTAMLYAVIGLIVTGLSFVLVTFVQSIFY